MITACSSCAPAIAFAAATILAFFGLLLAAAVSDVRTMTIPNSLSIALALLYPAYAYAVGADWIDGLIAGAIVFAVGFVFFALNWLGGGDVKLLAAISLWAGTPLLVPVLLVTVLAGGLLCLAVWARRGGPLRIYQRLFARLRREEGRPEAPADAVAAVPYAVAIFVGGTFVAVVQMLPLYRLAETVL